MLFKRREQATRERKRQLEVSYHYTDTRRCNKKKRLHETYLEFIEPEFGGIALSHAERVEPEISSRCVRALKCGKLNEANDEDNLGPALNWDGVDGLDGVGFCKGRGGQVYKFLDKHTEAREHTAQVKGGDGESVLRHTQNTQRIRYARETYATRPFLISAAEVYSRLR